MNKPICKSILKLYKITSEIPLRSQEYPGKYHWYCETMGITFWIYMTANVPPTREEQKLISYVEILAYHLSDRVSGAHKQYPGWKCCYTKDSDGNYIRTVAKIHMEDPFLPDV